MQNLRTRLDRLETTTPPQGAPLYVFGNDSADLGERLAIAALAEPTRPLIGLRWLDEDEVTA